MKYRNPQWKFHQFEWKQSWDMDILHERNFCNKDGKFSFKGLKKSCFKTPTPLILLIFLLTWFVFISFKIKFKNRMSSNFVTHWEEWEGENRVIFQSDCLLLLQGTFFLIWIMSMLWTLPKLLSGRITIRRIVRRGENNRKKNKKMEKENTKKGEGEHEKSFTIQI